MKQIYIVNLTIFIKVMDFNEEEIKMLRTFKRMSVTIIEGRCDKKEFCRCVGCGCKENDMANAGFTGEVVTDEWPDDLGERVSKEFPDLVLKIEEEGEFWGFFKNGGRNENPKTLNMELEKFNLSGATDGAIYSSEDLKDNLTSYELEKLVEKSLKAKTRYGDLAEISQLNLHIYEESIYMLVAVLNTCHDVNIKVALWYYNETGYCLYQEAR